MKLTSNFYLKEFVPEHLHNVFGDKCVRYLDPRLPMLMQLFRDRYEKPITVNGKIGDKTFNYRGYRDDSFYYKKEGGLYKIIRKGLGSQHRFGRAADFNVHGMSDDEVREDIKKNFDIYRKAGLTTIEEGISGWIHVDMRVTNIDELFIVYP